MGNGMSMIDNLFVNLIKNVHMFRDTFGLIRRRLIVKYCIIQLN